MPTFKTSKSSHTVGFQCRKTGKTYDLNEPRWKSDADGLLDIIYEKPPKFDPENATRPGLWRYRDVIPVEKDDNILSFGDGYTPLIPYSYGGQNCRVKLDYFFVTGSFKDRGAAVLISKVKELGIKHVVEDSSGNAGSSIAAYCAKAGISCDVYVSENASPAKLTQIAMYGARIIKIAGDRTKVTEAVMEAAEKHYYASHYWNPFFFEGTKTYAYEVWEQMGRNVPDTLIVQAGHGTLVFGVWIGFRELMAAGLSDKMPKIIAVQAENCAPVYNLFHGNKSVPHQNTIAEGIDVINPPRNAQMCNLIRETEGEVLQVSDKAIQLAMKDTAAHGLYIEPAAASALAAFAQYKSAPGEEVVVSLTGHGLKATDKYQKICKSG